MASNLRKVLFGNDLMPHVISFNCGTEIYEEEVSTWIRDREAGALSVMEKYGTHVWLYINEEGDIVGFGSLGTTKWSYPERHSKSKAKVNLIPAVAIETRFQGKPEGEHEDRFSTQIMRDLIYEARNTPDTVPILGLFVHPANRRAIGLYRRMGFQDFYQTSNGEDPNVRYGSMILDLRNGTEITSRDSQRR
jgi:GNAT superfamily N-acetyltransferase